MPRVNLLHLQKQARYLVVGDCVDAKCDAEKGGLRPAVVVGDGDGEVYRVRFEKSGKEVELPRKFIFAAWSTPPQADKA
jgi:hypothetical protein